MDARPHAGASSRIEWLDVVAGWPLPDQYQVRRFDETGEVAIDDVLALWAQEGILPANEARRRVSEIHVVATHVDVGLVGVSTAYLGFNAQLRSEMWHLRTFTAPAHRRNNVAWRLGFESFLDLETRFVSGIDRRGLGIVSVTENSQVRAHHRRAQLASNLDYFIGLNDVGHHVRALYFPGATVPTP